ncbi:protein S100-A10-like [Pseudophryne corroboree]|uniref:protein S100-A10-like n=1 Tax=Pseudophryne corroboree TaxID=495146 RepID=UPI003081BA7E
MVPSELEQAMEILMFTFHKYAGDKNYMSKEDLHKMMDKEFGEFLKNQNDALAVDKIMKDLDQCRDGRVNFHSYFSLIAGLTIACNDYYSKNMKSRK